MRKTKKPKSRGCSCIRRQSGKSPKLVASICHGVSGYHPSARERIRGKRLERAWLRELRALEPDDVAL